MKIGFIGLGGMGSAMVRNLVKNGHKVVAWNRSYEPTKAINAIGVAIERVPADVARECEIVISMLADDAAVETVTLGKDGIIEGLAEGAHVSMSTISVALSERLAEAHAARAQD